MYITFNGGWTWYLAQQLFIERVAADFFGYSVSVSGNIIVVGSHGDDDIGPISGDL